MCVCVSVVYSPCVCLCMYTLCACPLVFWCDSESVYMCLFVCVSFVPLHSMHSRRHELPPFASPTQTGRPSLSNRQDRHRSARSCECRRRLPWRLTAAMGVAATLPLSLPADVATGGGGEIAGLACACGRCSLAGSSVLGSCVEGDPSAGRARSAEGVRSGWC